MGYITLVASIHKCPILPWGHVDIRIIRLFNARRTVSPNRIYINAEYLATKIADVADVIYIGDSSDRTTKQIIFSDGARISTYNDGLGVPYTGLFLSASTLKLGSKIDLTGCNEINWGNNAPVAVFG